MAKLHENHKRWTCESKNHHIAGISELIMLGYDQFPKALPLPDHSHDQAYEFVYCDRGKVTWEVNQSLYETSAGQTFHTRPNEKHRAQMNFIEPCSIWWFIIKDPEQTPGWLGLSDEDRYQISSAMQSLPRIAPTADRVRNIFSEMRAAIEQNAPLSALKIRLELLNILLYLIDPGLSPKVPDKLLAGLDQVKESMILAPELRRSNREWADELGVSESYFYRLFKETFGQSPASFAERHSIKKAIELLQSTSLTITDIAMDLGFKTSQHFATVFKKHTGVTPTNWRYKNR